MMNKKSVGMLTIKPTPNYYAQESSRLRFVPFEQENIKEWSLFFENNPSERFVGFENSPLSNIEKSKGWIEKQMERKANAEFGQLAVVDKKSGDFIGVGGVITRIINDTTEYEITYSLLPKYFGKGYATELAIHFKRYMLEMTESVISVIHIENNASMQVAQKNGMMKESETTFLNMPVYIFRTKKNKAHNVSLIKG